MPWERLQERLEGFLGFPCSWCEAARTFYRHTYSTNKSYGKEVV
jgi:hypothetical protein